MSKDVFVGRRVLIKNFRDSLVATALETKAKPKKQKDGPPAYPQLFLLYGEPGMGRSAMMRQCSAIAEGVSAETKKSIKTIAVDFNDPLFTRNILPFTPRMVIHHLHAVLTDPGLGLEETFSEYSQMEARLDQVIARVSALRRDEWRRTPQGDGEFDLSEEPAQKAASQTTDAVNGAPPHARMARQEAEAAFLRWLKDEKKLPGEDCDLFENADGRLTSTLVNGIVALSVENPVALLLDNVERVSNPMIEFWLRNVFLGKLFEQKSRVVAVVSSRDKMLRQYRNEFPEELLCAVSFDDLPFSYRDIDECGQALGVTLDGDAAVRIEEATAGVPIVVRDVFASAIGGAVPADVLDGVRKAHTVLDKTATIVTRFLSTCDDERTLTRIINLAMLPHHDRKALAALWGVPAAEAEGWVAEMAQRYPFLSGGRMHDGVLELFRRYLVKESAAAMAPHAGIIKEFGAAAFAQYNEQVCQLQTAVQAIDKRYIDDRFETTLLGCIQSLLWYDRDEVARVIPGHFCECLLYNHVLAGMILAALEEFIPVLPSAMASLCGVLASGLHAVEGLPLWSGEKPSAAENALTAALADAGKALSTSQQAVVHLRLASSAFRRAEFDKAFGELEKCEPHVDESEMFRDMVVEGFFGVGAAFVSARQYETAIKAFGRAAEIRPDRYDAWYSLGCSYAALKRHVQAEDSLAKAAACKPDSFETWHGLAFEQYEQKKFKEAAGSFAKAAALRADSAEVWHMLGLSQAALDDHSAAIESYRKAIACASGDDACWHDLALSQAALGQAAAAVVSCRKVLELSPAHQKAAELLGQQLYAQKLYREAAQAFETAARLNPQDEKVWYGLGCAQLDAGDAGKAVDSFTKATDIKKDFPDAFNKAGLANAAMKNFDAAVAAYKKAVKAMAGHFEAHNNLGDAYRELKKPEDALKAYTKSSESNPGFGPAWYNMGLTLHALGRFEEALPPYAKAEELLRGQPGVSLNKGLAFYALKKFDEAARCFTKATELSQDSYEAWFNLGRVLADTAKHEEAVAALSQACALRAEKEEAWLALGISYAALEQHDEAVTAFKKAAAINPGAAGTWHLMGVSNQAVHCFSEAVDAYREAVKADPGKQESWQNAGLCSYYQKKYDEAIEFLSKARELSPNSKDTLYTLGLCHHAKGKFAEAVALYRKVLDLAPDMANARTNLALSLHAAGDYVEAVKVYKTIVDKQPGNSDAWFNMGIASEAQGNNDGAIAAFAKAAELAPDKLAAWSNKGRIQFSLERYADAIASFTKVVERSAADADAWGSIALASYYTGRYDGAVAAYKKVNELKPGDAMTWGSLGLTYYTMGDYAKAIEASEKALAIKPDELWIQVNLALAAVMALNMDKAKAAFEKIIELAKAPGDLMHAIASLKELVARNPNLGPAREILVKLEDAWRKLKK
ncbi:MAG TPA: tetratricopeptide repeat protein [Chitinivibrionales bacterium]|nr:tetratricopeptide repeat protein [Chitinivibrionales bacterium]